jgi:hypothetical protein
VSPEAVAAVEGAFPPPSGKSLHLLPAEMETLIRVAYSELGQPTIDFTSAWSVYRSLVACVEAYVNPDPELGFAAEGWLLPELLQSDPQWHTPPEGMQLLDGMPLDTEDPDGPRYQGGVRGGLGMESSDDEEGSEQEIVYRDFAGDDLALAAREAGNFLGGAQL